MNEINVPFTNEVNKNSCLEEIAAYLATIESHAIAIAPWPLPGIKPKVSFSIAHTGDAILIRYMVAEHGYIPPVYRKSNEPVYKDSCVEFFISPQKDAGYYNFEFNSIGACLMGFADKARNLQGTQPPELIEKIRRSARVAPAPSASGETSWQLTLALPVEIFIHHNIRSLTGMNSRANFYKCGDDLPHPQFLAWNNIEAPKPNFHLPQFFGRLNFKPAQ